jgi:hypothetical protein
MLTGHRFQSETDQLQPEQKNGQPCCKRDQQFAHGSASPPLIPIYGQAETGMSSKEKAPSGLEVTVISAGLDFPLLIAKARPVIACIIFPNRFTCLLWGSRSCPLRTFRTRMRVKRFTQEMVEIFFHFQSKRGRGQDVAS